MKLRSLHPDAHIIAHPECTETLLGYAHHIGSTSSLLKYAETHPGEEFIVLTEPGIIHQMRQRSANSLFYPVPGAASGACTRVQQLPVYET